MIDTPLGVDASGIQCPITTSKIPIPFAISKYFIRFPEISKLQNPKIPKYIKSKLQEDTPLPTLMYNKKVN